MLALGLAYDGRKVYAATLKVGVDGARLTQFTHCDYAEGDYLMRLVRDADVVCGDNWNTTYVASQSRSFVPVRMGRTATEARMLRFREFAPTRLANTPSDAAVCHALIAAFGEEWWK